MKKFSIYLLIVSLILIFFCSVSFTNATTLWEEIQKKGVLEVGVASCEPACIIDPVTGEWSGVAVDIMKRLAEVLNVEFKPVPTTWDYMIAGLQAGKWDIAASLNTTPDRTLAIDFSVPFYYCELTLVYNKGNPKIPKNPTFSDFDKPGINISVMAGSANEKGLTRAVKNANIIRIPDISETRMAVVSGRADAVCDDDSANNLFALANAEWSAILIPEPPIGKTGACFGFREGHYADIETLNVLITNMKNDGELRELEEKYGTIIKESF